MRGHVNRLFAVSALAALLVHSAAAQSRGKFLYGDGKAMFGTLPPDRTVKVNTGMVQNWTGSFDFNGTTFSYTMVGTDPALGSASTVVPTQIIPLIFKFSDGTVLDPTVAACGAVKSAVQSAIDSPVFHSTDFTPGGTNVGNSQYADAFQRANFWSFVSATAPAYHVLLAQPQVVPPVTIEVPRGLGRTTNGPCAKVGQVNLSYFSLKLRGLISGIPSTSLPIFLSYNTFFTDRGCCIVGLNTVYGSAPNQLTVAVAAYSDAGIFDQPIQDIYGLSRAIGEWMDDPFLTNIVPDWTGGEVVGCEDLLEVGAPVDGRTFQVTVGGQTYHPSDLVFLPWFEKSYPSRSVNGWYTFQNNYSGPVMCEDDSR
ncbi:MAG: hypothetical protein C5B51_14120 [Terriglobia bacterium]|nr:MAG: hypothetical protein C5B51_14120 [Terriglobia bacterium]